MTNELHELRRQRAATFRIEGGLLFAPAELSFDPQKPYTYCRLCGAVYQEARDRQASSVEDIFDRMMVRRNWSFNHAKQHPARAHERLALSGLHVTPEAANKLASFGISFIGAGVLSDEHRYALAEAANLPQNDSEGS